MAYLLQHLNIEEDKGNDASNEEKPRSLLSQHLDWNDYSSHQHTSSLQLVIGSELVYSQETAHACAQVVLSILHQHPDVLVFILQVTDRDGWKNVFLPALRGHADIKVVEEPMEDFSLHQVGSQLIPPGGTLDRFAFGGCFIFSKSSLLVKK